MPKTKMLHAPRFSPAAAREILVGGLGIVAVVLAGVGVATVGGNLPVGLDQAWHDVLAAYRFPAAGAIAGALHVVGGTLVMTIISALVVVVLLIMRRFRAALSVGLAMALSAGISTVLKAALARPRPSDGIVDTASNAFPSGHATAAAAITIALLIAFPRVWTRVLAAVWITLMALSRTYLLVHWLSDVIAGAVLGASAALLVFGVMRLFLKEPSPQGARIPGERQATSTSLTS